jgi:tetratricopeptide (TPR) repeat protein
MPETSARDRLFISYRRDDARGASGRLYDWLRIAFGRERVFRDVASIGVGRWRDRIDQALARSAVCVAVIGPRWANPDNLPRLHDGNDLVRHKLATALGDAAITPVPVLVEGAEDAFEREYAAQQQAEQAARRAQAEAARNVANLALLRDVTKAVAYYRKAAAADPEDAETWRLLGEALIPSGDTEAAGEAFSRALETARAQGDTWGEMWAQVGLGDVFVKTRHLAAAGEQFEAALRTAQRRLEADPEDPARQRDLSVSHNKIGDVLVAQGDGPGALAAFRKGLAIREALAARDPANALWQTDVAVSCAKLGLPDHDQTPGERRALPLRGRDILTRLKQTGRLLPSQDWIAWFDEQIAALPAKDAS